MKTLGTIIAYLFLVLVIIFIGFTIRLKEKDRQYEALLNEANFAIRFIEQHHLIVQYDWQRKNVK